MAESPHYKELLHALNEFEVEYLIVGGYAVMKYTEPRYTKDLDVWVHNSPRNSAGLFRAPAKFGAPLAHDGITPETFQKDSIVYQIGVPPVRIVPISNISSTFTKRSARRSEHRVYSDAASKGFRKVPDESRRRVT